MYVININIKNTITITLWLYLWLSYTSEIINISWLISKLCYLKSCGRPPVFHPIRARKLKMITYKRWIHVRAKGSCCGKRSVEKGEDGKKRDGRRARVGRVPVAAGDSVSATLLSFNPSYSFSMNEYLCE